MLIFVLTGCFLSKNSRLLALIFWFSFRQAKTAHRNEEIVGSIQRVLPNTIEPAAAETNKPR
jgi:hypothetical protein